MPDDYYAALGLDQKLTLDAADLEQRFYARSRQLHPDRFMLRPEPERVAAEQSSALLNDAYRTLRSPVARAEYVLKQNGFDIGEQQSKDVPPELLEEVFELNMALEELRGGDAAARPQLEHARERFLGMRAEIDAALEDLFRRHDQGGGRGTLIGIRQHLNRRRYVDNLVREVEKELA